jgi:hypothetical protein
LVSCLLAFSPSIKSSVRMLICGKATDGTVHPDQEMGAKGGGARAGSTMLDRRSLDRATDQRLPRAGCRVCMPTPILPSLLGATKRARANDTRA